MQTVDDLRHSRYALLRTYRRDGTPVDTPIWFAFDGSALVFRTKIGPKTRRLTHDPRVQLRVCDHRGRVSPEAGTVDGRATILAGAPAAAADELLRRRYGWQYNVVPLLKIPGVRNVHSNLPWREKMRRARARHLWHDSAIVRIDL
ncbi:PPOX class F420-dependent oxidoreductase [Mycobacterium sp. CPCC 205372]|uniref:PPOX class F420-dependent oxidoreductase n=1 Tax=Mycobacterium hippophais TaxID=3016340 RepID=A0ABT4PSW4_9MYCO|nr:PPOX class F420-dependent oxidoreductase [Mycobacterium hippophais]MCZ8379664.1 PPOX class F420-dependent oxidoreductase [Mycobacterium hippophais]